MAEPALRVLIVEARFYSDLADELLRVDPGRGRFGCQQALPAIDPAEQGGR